VHTPVASHALWLDSKEQVGKASLRTQLLHLHLLNQTLLLPACRTSLKIAMTATTDHSQLAAGTRHRKTPPHESPSRSSPCPLLCTAASCCSHYGTAIRDCDGPQPPLLGFSEEEAGWRPVGGKWKRQEWKLLLLLLLRRTSSSSSYRLLPRLLDTVREEQQLLRTVEEETEDHIR
jgi:hypothetical protein